MNEEKQDHRLYMEERQEKILQLLDSQEVVRISDLSDYFQVSSATLRKDLSLLERDGKLRRTHGGAIKANPHVTELSLKAAIATAHNQKVRIGRAAAQLVHDDDVLLIQSGTTGHEFARALKGKHRLTILTGDLSVVLILEENLPDSTIVLLGGVLRNGYHYTEDVVAIRQLANYCVPVAFIGANAFSFENGFTTYHVEILNWIEKIFKVSDKKVMLIDSTKFNSTTFVKIADLDDVDCLITDSDLDERTRARLAEEAPDLDIIYA